jgi:hypothetical protein
MENKIKELKKRIENQKQRMECQEIGNDLYYTSPSYKRDSRVLSTLENELKTLEEADRYKAISSPAAYFNAMISSLGINQ